VSIVSLAIHTITIERATVTHDALGGEVETWAATGTVSARVQPLSGRETLAYSRETETITHKTYVPGAHDILAKDRFTFRNRTYIIRAVRNTDELDHHMVLECEVQT
jgi:SPP1 family predicted phage head-tail adaptor